MESILSIPVVFQKFEFWVHWLF